MVAESLRLTERGGVVDRKIIWPSAAPKNRNPANTNEGNASNGIEPPRLADCCTLPARKSRITTLTKT
jgi:hypothetical protein